MGWLDNAEVHLPFIFCFLCLCLLCLQTQVKWLEGILAALILTIAAFSGMYAMRMWLHQIK
jgi:hypothetical protein